MVATGGAEGLRDSGGEGLRVPDRAACLEGLRDNDGAIPSGAAKLNGLGVMTSMSIKGVRQEDCRTRAVVGGGGNNGVNSPEASCEGGGNNVVDNECSGERRGGATRTLAGPCSATSTGMRFDVCRAGPSRNCSTEATGVAAAFKKSAAFGALAATGMSKFLAFSCTAAGATCATGALDSMGM